MITIIASSPNIHLLDFILCSPFEVCEKTNKQNVNRPAPYCPRQAGRLNEQTGEIQWRGRTITDRFGVHMLLRMRTVALPPPSPLRIFRLKSFKMKTTQCRLIPLRTTNWAAKRINASMHTQRCQGSFAARQVSLVAAPTKSQITTSPPAWPSHPSWVSKRGVPLAQPLPSSAVERKFVSKGLRPARVSPI